MNPFKRSGYWQHVRPIGMFADFAAVWKQAGTNRWRIAAASAVTTFGLFSLMGTQGGEAPHPPPEITYITTFAPGRSYEEIKASNAEHQKIKDKLMAEKAEREEEVRDIYRTLGRMSGLDVERIEQRAKAEREAEEKAFLEDLARQRGQAPSGE